MRLFLPKGGFDPPAPAALGLWHRRGPRAPRSRGRRLSPARPSSWPGSAGGSGGQVLRLWAGQEPWAPDRLFLPHRKMEPAWSAIAFAVDVSEMYDVERQALAAYGSIFKPTGDQLSMLYEVEDACWGCVCGTFPGGEPVPARRPDGRSRRCARLTSCCRHRATQIGVAARPYPVASGVGLGFVHLRRRVVEAGRHLGVSDPSALAWPRAPRSAASAASPSMAAGRPPQAGRRPLKGAPRTGAIRQELKTPASSGTTPTIAITRPQTPWT